MIGKNSMKRHYLKKKYFYSHLNMEDVTDADYTHAKRVCKDFEIKNLGNMMICMFKVMELLLAIGISTYASRNI